MGKAIEVETELSLAELEGLYRNARTTIEQRRAHVILLRAEGMAPTQVARITRLAPRTISTYVRRFNESGAASLCDARSANPGRPPLLDAQARQALEHALQSPPEDEGRWTGPKVTRWLEAHLELEPNSLDNARGWETLKSLGYSYKSSRPRHTKSADASKREQWKKKSGTAP